MFSELLSSINEPNYDVFLKDIDFSPHLCLSNKFDKQVRDLMNRLKQSGYSKDFALKVAAEAMRRYDKNMEELLKNTEAYNSEEP